MTDPIDAMIGDFGRDVAASERVKRAVLLDEECDFWRTRYLDAMEQHGWDRAKLEGESPRLNAAENLGTRSAIRTMFDAHQKMREERDCAIGALLCATWHGCLSFDRARELLGMSTLALRAEAQRIFKEEPA